MRWLPASATLTHSHPTSAFSCGMPQGRPVHCVRCKRQRARRRAKLSGTDSFHAHPRATTTAPAAVALTLPTGHLPSMQPLFNSDAHGNAVTRLDVTKHLLLGRDTALMAHGLTMRRATASDADCVFIAGCVDAASNHAVREEWFLRARASSAKAATAKLGPRVRLGSPAREGAFDATASHRFHDPVSHTSLETGKRIIQTDATSWHHHSNAWIICNGRGVRQYGAYTVHPTKIARRHRTLTYPDGRAYEAFLSALLHYDDVDRGGRGRGMAYCMGLSAATQLDASEAQLQPFINAARSTPHFPFDECAQLNRAYVEAHGLAAVSFIAYDDDCHIRFFKKMGARVVQRVVLPDSGQRLVGMLMGEVCEEW